MSESSDSTRSSNGTGTGTGTLSSSSTTSPPLSDSEVHHSESNGTNSLSSFSSSSSSSSTPLSSSSQTDLPSTVSDFSSGGDSSSSSGSPSSAAADFSSLLEKSSSKAQSSKVTGNDHFANRRFREALDCYTESILYCPDSDTANKSIYYTNRGAAHLMLDENKECVSDCTEAMKSPDIASTILVKALSRRAQAYEKLDQLQDALNDVKQLVNLQPTDSSFKANEARLTKLVNEKNEKMKEEMLGKLKDLGNGILGKFGMSLDDFKAQKDPNTGSYSISFGKK